MRSLHIHKDPTDHLDGVAIANNNINVPVVLTSGAERFAIVALNPTGVAANAVVKLYGSLNGSVWFDTTVTLTVAAGANGATAVQDAVWPHYRVNIASTGTGRVSLVATSFSNRGA